MISTTYIPISAEGQFFILIFLSLGLGYVLWIEYRNRRRQSAAEKLLRDDRYHQALAIYASNLPAEQLTRNDRREALAAATIYLVKEHGVDSSEAAPNMRLVVEVYDHDQSYDLRNKALACEEAGDYETALVYFERAAQLQEEHDPKDYQFLQRSAARVRSKIPSR